MPIDPPPSQWDLPPASTADEYEIVGVGADLEPGTILDAYRGGLFPMRLRRGGQIAWWSPDPRAILPLDGLHVSRSLRSSLKKFDMRIDTAFVDVMRGCADPSRPDGWIDDSFIDAYSELHRLGWAHSVETWSEDNTLVGGLYGLAIGGFFAGESMFHRVTDASKAAVVATVELLRERGGELFDVQWSTPHLRSLGVIDLPRALYLERLATAVTSAIDPFEV